MLQDEFSSLYSIDGTAYGLHLSKRNLRELDSFISFILENKLNEIESKVFSTELVYCLTVGAIHKSEESTRGVKIMGLAVLSLNKNISQFDSLLAIALDKIMQRPERASRVLKKVYRTVNSVQFPIQDKTENQIKILRFCVDRGYQFESTSTTSFEYDGLKIYTEFNSLLLEDEVVNSNVKKLFDIFQEKLIMIYNCLIQEKRVVVFGRNKPCHVICNMTLAVASLVSPPIPYITKQHVFPYVALSELDFLNSSCFIAGANNPLFRHREQWWDLLADIDTGEVITSVATPKFLTEFMRNLIENLRFDPNPELLLKSQFCDFTQHILDSKIYFHIFQMFDNKIPEIEINAELAQEYLALKKKCEGVLNDEVYVVLLKLRLMHITEKYDGVEKVYKELYDLLWESDNLEYFLSVLPNWGDLHCVAAGLFVDNVKVWRYACKILTMIEEHQQGKYLVMLLQTNELNAYVAYKNRI